jgi:chorismate mutase
VIGEDFMSIRGIRGAVAVDQDTPEQILQATRQLLEAVQAANSGLVADDIASIFFTATPDLKAAHPALAARQLGWVHVPLLCAQEIPVPGSLPRVIRILVHWNTITPQVEIRHVYLGAASVLRPDLEAAAVQAGSTTNSNYRRNYVHRHANGRDPAGDQ